MFMDMLFSQCKLISLRESLFVLVMLFYKYKMCTQYKCNSCNRGIGLQLYTKEMIKRRTKPAAE